jgi:hypothetical protein
MKVHHHECKVTSDALVNIADPRRIARRRHKQAFIPVPFLPYLPGEVNLRVHSIPIMNFPGRFTSDPWGRIFKIPEALQAA